MEDYTEIFNKTSKMYFPIIASFAAIIALWTQFETLVIPIVIGIFVLCFLVNHGESIRPRYLEDQQKIIDVLTNHLKRTKDSIYYFGGAGFIGSSDIWKETLSQKLNDPKIETVRIIDLKKPHELELLLSNMDSEKVKEEVIDYRRWLKTHADYLKKSNVNNFFYSYEGAPIWKHGMNYIVFDKKILAVITPCTTVERKVIIISSPKIAEEFANSIDFVVKQFGLESYNGEGLEKIYEEKPE